MPRGIKNKPPIDICRVRTDRLRDMTTAQLRKANVRVGRLYNIPKKEVRGPRWWLSSFIGSLVTERTINPKEYSPEAVATYKRAYPNETKPPLTEAQTRKMYREMADEAERKIWDLQMKRGCKISDTEVVARDIEREHQDRDRANAIRGKRRAKIR